MNSPYSPISRTSPACPTSDVCVRLRFNPAQVRAFETIRSFTGSPSLSQTVARLALWNAEQLRRVLSSSDSVLCASSSYPVGS